MDQEKTTIKYDLMKDIRAVYEASEMALSLFGNNNIRATKAIMQDIIEKCDNIDRKLIQHYGDKIC